jgi:hypothetical protein
MAFPQNPGLDWVSATIDSTKERTGKMSVQKESLTRRLQPRKLCIKFHRICNDDRD